MGKTANQAIEKWALNIKSSFVCMPVLVGVISACGMKCYTAVTPELSVKVLRKLRNRQTAAAGCTVMSYSYFTTSVATLYYNGLCCPKLCTAVLPISEVRIFFFTSQWKLTLASTLTPSHCYTLKILST